MDGRRVKQLEAENAELKKEIQAWKDSRDGVLINVQKLRAENEELKVREEKLIQHNLDLKAEKEVEK